MQGNSPQVFGVTHTVLKPRRKPLQVKKRGALTEHAQIREQIMENNEQSNEVLRLLKAMRKNGKLPAKVALEAIPHKKRLYYARGRDWKDTSGHRFFRAVVRHLRKNGGKVIELENEPVEILFRRLYWILTEATLNGHSFFPHLLDTRASNKWQNQPGLSKALLKMSTYANKALGNKPFSKKWALKAFDFADALNVHRSLLMHQRAQALGADAIVVGGAHASHLKQLGLTSPNYTYRDNLRVKLAQRDVRNYQKYVRQIKRLDGIAREFFPLEKS